MTNNLTPMPGNRAGLAYSTLTDGTWQTFTADRDFIITEIRLQCGDGTNNFDENDTVAIEAEGQSLFGGALVPIALVGNPSPDAVGTSAVHHWNLVFAKPLIWTRSFPLKIKVTGKAARCLVHGVAA